jgi:hypothetical protein
MDKGFSSCACTTEEVEKEEEEEDEEEEEEEEVEEVEEVGEEGLWSTTAPLLCSRSTKESV